MRYFGTHRHGDKSCYRNTSTASCYVHSLCKTKRDPASLKYVNISIWNHNDQLSGLETQLRIFICKNTNIYNCTMILELIMFNHIGSKCLTLTHEWLILKTKCILRSNSTHAQSFWHYNELDDFPAITWPFVTSNTKSTTGTFCLFLKIMRFCMILETIKQAF